MTQPQNKGWKGHWPSSVTQFVVGAVGESDLELMVTTEYLYRKLQLKRTYYSSFNPINDTPLENLPPSSPEREHRLYQASFLLRDYGFFMEDLPFDSSGHLPLDKDPKYVWATQNLLEHPVEINRADKHMLLRIPGIGLKNADSILRERSKNKLSRPEELLMFGINLKTGGTLFISKW